jgi:hypothetical protein
MCADTERSLRRWKWTAVLAIASGAILLAALAVNLLSLRRPIRKTDERLIGTWQSDADRTIAVIRHRRPDEQQEAALRKIFGKLWVTYGDTACTTELDGVVESNRYEVLGRDKQSVVIREIRPKPLPLELSEFVVIHFDGPDSYWLYTEIGGIQEYFRRVHR